MTTLTNAVPNAVPTAVAVHEPSAVSRRSLRALGAGAIAGTAMVTLIPDAWLGDALVPMAVPWGINLVLVVGIVIATSLWFARCHSTAIHRETAWIAVAALLVAAGAAWRSSDELRVLDVGALGVLAVLATFSLRGVSARGRYLVEYVTAAIRTGFSAATAVLRLAFIDIEWNAGASPPSMRGASGVAWGIVLAVPFVLLFGALFAAADTVFSRMVWEAFSLDLSTAAARGFHALVFGAAIAGFLREAFIAERTDTTPPRSASEHLGVPVVTALSAVTLLFLTFVVIQVRYLYGGDAQVQAIAGLTYAEYARRGFFELVTASVLVLPLLMLVEWTVRNGDDGIRRLSRIVSATLLALLGVIMMSAFTRLQLYVDAYGLTVDRFYAAAALAYLAIVLGWFAVTALRGRPAKFVFGSAVAGLAVLGSLHVINPDALILRHNLARDGGRPFDTRHAASLSADAAAELEIALQRFGSEVSPGLCAIAKRVESWRGQPSDWRAWNAARSRARRIAEGPAATKAATACAAVAAASSLRPM